AALLEFRISSWLLAQDMTMISIIGLTIISSALHRTLMMLLSDGQFDTTLCAMAEYTREWNGFVITLVQAWSAPRVLSPNLLEAVRRAGWSPTNWEHLPAASSC